MIVDELEITELTEIVKRAFDKYKVNISKNMAGYRLTLEIDFNSKRELLNFCIRRNNVINVKVVPSREKIYQEDMRNLVYYSCKRKTTQKQYVFFICPPSLSDVNDKRQVVWLNSEYGKDGIGYDYFSILEEDYYDFHEIKDADLTFYV